MQFHIGISIQRFKKENVLESLCTFGWDLRGIQSKKEDLHDLKKDRHRFFSAAAKVRKRRSAPTKKHISEYFISFPRKNENWEFHSLKIRDACSTADIFIHFQPAAYTYTYTHLCPPSSSYIYLCPPAYTCVHLHLTWSTLNVLFSIWRDFICWPLNPLTFPILNFVASHFRHFINLRAFCIDLWTLSDLSHVWRHFPTSLAVMAANLA